VIPPQKTQKKDDNQWDKIKYAEYKDKRVAVGPNTIADLKGYYHCTDKDAIVSFPKLINLLSILKAGEDSIITLVLEGGDKVYYNV